MVEILFYGVVPLLAILLIVMAVAVPIAASFRRRAWVAVRPRVFEVDDEQLPPAVRRMLVEVGPQLLAAGFVRAAAVHALEFSVHADWTQVLFVNRSTGERASVFGHHEAGNDYFEFCIATELPTHDSVVTAPAGDPATGVPRTDARIDLPTLLGDHRTRVRDTLGLSPNAALPSGMIPAAGSEVAWLHEKAVRVAHDVAQRLGFHLDARGEAYRPPWHVALNWAMHHPLESGRAKPTGFEVVRPRDDVRPRP